MKSIDSLMGGGVTARPILSERIMNEAYRLLRGIDKRKWIMRINLTAFIITVLLFQVSAASKAQITLNEKGGSLQKVLKDISKQSGYDFIYSDQDLANSNPVTISIKNANLESALEVCFANQPLVYAITERTVLIKRKEPAPVSMVSDSNEELFAGITIRGRVVDANGQGLGGASIKIKSTDRTVIADANGIFILDNVEENVVLVVSFVGYVSLEIKSVKEFMSVVLKPSTSKLDEVQVIGYGTTTQRMNTGNVSTVKAEDIAKQPVQNPLLALQGRVPGLVIEQKNGYSSSGVKVRIQGQNSITSDNYPLYVIDGVPYAPQLMPNNGFLLGYSDPGSGLTMSREPGFGNPLNYINPGDIESIDVLKDAAATSIYGSRAANGAILITTKKGKAGAMRTELNMQHGVSKVAKKMKLLNTGQYLEMRREAYLNDGFAVPDQNTTPSMSNYDLTVWDQNRYTDWQEEMLGGSANYTNLQGSISGGSGNTQYLLSSTYMRQTPVLRGDFADQSASMHVNLSSASLNQRFKVNFSTSYMMNNNKIVNRDLTQFALNVAPNAPALYNENGSLNWQPIKSGNDEISTFQNPLAFMSFKYNSQISNLVSNILLSYTLFPGLDLKANFGYTRTQISDMSTSSDAIIPEELTSNNRYLNIGSSIASTWVVSPQLTYKKAIGKGQLEALVGADVDQRKGNGMNIQGTGFTTDLLQEDISAATSKTIRPTADFKYKFNAAFGRLNYNWDKKYIVELTARRDGSSRFGAENRFNNYGAISGAWIFSNENLFKNHLTAFSFGKLKASYGTTGNDQIGDYQYLNTYISSFSLPYQGVQGLLANKLNNPYLQWEETKKFNVGIDLGFAQDRLLIGANYYRNRSGNQLLPYDLPGTTGFRSMLQNFPAVLQNSGWEFTISSTNISNKNLSWRTSFNLSLAGNKLVSWPDLSTSSYRNRYIIGQPISVQKFHSFAGVNPATGNYQYTKADGSLTDADLNYEDDYTVLADFNPKFYGGLQNTLSYKSFDLTMMFSFNKRKVRNNYYRFDQPGLFESSNGNQPISVLDRWQNKNDNASIEKYSTMKDYSRYFLLESSNATLTDITYARLENVSLSWSTPKKWTHKVRLQQARLFVQGQKLLTITKFSGLDPETGLSMPPLRVITIGTQITF